MRLLVVAASALVLGAALAGELAAQQSIGVATVEPDKAAPQEPARTNPEPPRAEPAPSEPAKSEPAKTEPTTAEPARSEPAPAAVATEPAKVEETLGALIARRVPEIAGKATPRTDTTAAVDFYNANPDKPIWFKDGAMLPRAAAAIGELKVAGDWGLNAAEFALPAVPANPDRAQLIDAEIRLTLAVLKYARHARGGRYDPRELSNNLDRTPPQVPAAKVLADVAKSDKPAAVLQSLHPQHPQFERLRQLYVSLRNAPPPAPVAAVEEEAPQGKGGKAAKKAKAAPAPETGSARKVLHNMEMWRWMPEDLGKTYVWSNIPEFTVRVVRNSKVVHTERIISGKTDTQTPIFSADMATVVFHPGWGVPNSIKVKELLPGLLRGNDTLGKSGLRASFRGKEVDPRSIDWTTTDIRNLDIIQPPGGSNVLGVVKFLFPNKHDVYMHDTPSKNLFNADVRTFSHGCMRVRNPVRLAEIVMEHRPGLDARARRWHAEEPGSRTTTFGIKNKIPVHVTYFTAMVDENGKPHYFRDIYGHEAKIQAGLDGKAAQIAAARKKEDLGAARAEVISKAGGRQVQRASSGGDWLSRMFSSF